MLEDAFEHLEQGGDFDHRIAMISIDNAVEIMAKTYLGLPEGAGGTSKPSRKEIEESGESFPRVIKLLKTYAADRIVGIDTAEIEWFHRIRNQLYHSGIATVPRSDVEAYAGIARALFENLFEFRLVLRSAGPPPTKIGKFIADWNALQELLRAKLPPKKAGELTLYRKIKFFSTIRPHLGELYSSASQFRNELVHNSTAVDPASIDSYLAKVGELLAACEDEEFETTRVSAAGSAGKSRAYVSSLNLNELRAKAREFFKEQLGQDVSEISSSLLESQDSSVGIRYSVSKPFPSGKYTQYWFALHDRQIDFLNRYRSGFAAFVCTGAGTLFAPWSEFEKYLDQLGETFNRERPLAPCHPTASQEWPVIHEAQILRT